VESEATIYLSDQRGRTQSDGHQSFHCFNFGAYQRENRKPFKRLVALNDETLMPGASLTYSIPNNHLIFLLPVIGGIEYQTIHYGVGNFVDVGRSILLTDKKGFELKITNVFQTEPVNFISCWFLDNSTIDRQAVEDTFELDASRDSLITLFSATNVTCRIGKFGGRKDYTLKLTTPFKDIFAFVLEGAFELQNRLLQQKDGLSMTHVSELEFEALSNDAIILIFEL
jgi:hypothetical protein